MTRPDILEVLEREGVQLKRYKALCLFHRESTPSFFVDPKKQRWHCFGCGESGDVIDLIQKLKGLDFKGALTYLGMKPGIKPKVNPKFERIKAYEAWLNNYYRQLCRESVMLHEIRVSVQANPGRFSEEETWEFAESMSTLAEVDYRLDLLWEGTADDRLSLFNEAKESTE